MSGKLYSTPPAAAVRGCVRMRVWATKLNKRREPHATCRPGAVLCKQNLRYLLLPSFRYFRFSLFFVPMGRILYKQIRCKEQQRGNSAVALKWWPHLCKHYTFRRNHLPPSTKLYSVTSQKIITVNIYHRPDVSVEWCFEFWRSCVIY
jgi:hypothetical protein